MRMFKISDELYEQMKRFIVDPFDDTPEVVIERLIEIVDKARSRWSPFEAYDPPEEAARPAEAPQEQLVPRRQEQQPAPRHQEQPAPQNEEQEVIL